jgi:galactose mutarotase-like enzyme
MPVYQLQNTSLSVKVNSFGAELCSVVSADSAIEYIWQADPSVWARHAPNLFPVVGKLKDDTYHYQSQSYHLPQHGFARDSEFICVEQTGNALVFELPANAETLARFPFHFNFQVSYTLTDNLLQVSYSVFNPDNYDLYFSVGAHPAFNCPLTSDEQFEDYKLLFPLKDQLEIHKLNGGLISRHTRQIPLDKNSLAVNKALFENDALVLMNSQIDEVKLVSGKTGHGVLMKAANWPYFGIWTKKDTGRFVCLEPWYGIADRDDSDGELQHKTGIIKLKAEERFQCSFDISFF